MPIAPLPCLQQLTYLLIRSINCDLPPGSPPDAGPTTVNRLCVALMEQTAAPVRPGGGGNKKAQEGLRARLAGESGLKALLPWASHQRRRIAHHLATFSRLISDADT